jgi:SAM-dependent methyltransferase
MKTSEELKAIVKEKYGNIVAKASEPKSSCCEPSCCVDTNDFSVMADDYRSLEGYNPDADLSLGCGLPTQHAHIKPGDTVVDLGSGAGNDCFVARSLTGPSGKVIGVDMTEKMVEKAIKNAHSLGYDNVEFVLGDIETIPLAEETADVVVSNCVMNLVPDKVAAFKETFRILKNGGHFSISDIVLRGELPEGLKNDAAMYAGCVSGALQQDEYLEIVRQAGFRNLKIQREKPISLPDEVWGRYLQPQEIAEFQQADRGIYSITVYAEK